MILWERGPFGVRRGVQAERRGRGGGHDGLRENAGVPGKTEGAPCLGTARAGASGFPIEKKPGASFRASFRRGSSTALYLNSPIKERFPTGKHKAPAPAPATRNAPAAMCAENNGRTGTPEFNPVDLHSLFCLLWQAFSPRQGRSIRHAPKPRLRTGAALLRRASPGCGLPPLQAAGDIPPLSCGQPRKLRQSGPRTPRRKPHRRPSKKMHQPSQALPPSPYRRLPLLPPRHHATTPRHPDTPPSVIPAFSPLSPSIFPFRVRPHLRTASVSASVPFPSPIGLSLLPHRPFLPRVGAQPSRNAESFRPSP